MKAAFRKERNNMSKSKRAILITLAVLLVLLTAALLFVYHTIDSASTPY